MMEDIGYLELKRAIEQTKEEMQRLHTINQINEIVLTALNKELEKYPEPTKDNE